MSDLCSRYKQKLMELKEFHAQFLLERARVEKDALIYNENGDDIREQIQALSQKIEDFKKEFKEFFS